MLINWFIVFQSDGKEVSPDIVPIDGGLKGWAYLSHYWDCCKPACAWPENVKNKSISAVTSCDKNGVTVLDNSTDSACHLVGTAYMCNNQIPWVSNRIKRNFVKC